jgi:hypothetical protein
MKRMLASYHARRTGPPAIDSPQEHSADRQNLRVVAVLRQRMQIAR